MKRLKIFRHLVAKDVWRLSLRKISKKNIGIPKIIHQLWIPPADLDAIPGDVLPQMKAWTDFHPDFEHRIWSIEEIASVLPARRAARMMEAVRVCRFEAMKADIVRLYLLSEFGGFWSDLKVWPRRRWLNDFLNAELVLIEHFQFDLLQNPAGVLTNNLIGSSPGNPFIERCIERAHLNIDNRLSTSVWHVAGIKVLMDVHANWSDFETYPVKYVVLPSEYVWGNLLNLGSGSYSSNNRHWSIREKSESIYIDP